MERQDCFSSLGGGVNGGLVKLSEGVVVPTVAGWLILSRSRREQGSATVTIK